MSTVITEINAGVAVLSLNRSEVGNGITPELVQELSVAIDAAVNDPGVRCLVLSGAGAHFTVGADINYFSERLKNCGEHEEIISNKLMSEAHGLIKALQLSPKPVIACLKGSVAGIGVGLAQACDLAIAATDTVYSLAYCHVGLSPDGGATYFLPRAVGLKRSMEMALLGGRYDATQLLSMGLVNRVVDPADLDAETIKLANRLAAGSAMSQAYTKELLNRSMQTDLDQQLDAEQQYVVNCGQGADFAEGVKAFFSGRKPRFGGESVV